MRLAGIRIPKFPEMQNQEEDVIIDPNDPDHASKMKSILRKSGSYHAHLEKPTSRILKLAERKKNYGGQQNKGRRGQKLDMIAAMLPPKPKMQKNVSFKFEDVPPDEIFN